MFINEYAPGRVISSVGGACFILRYSIPVNCLPSEADPHKPYFKGHPIAVILAVNMKLHGYELGRFDPSLVDVLHVKRFGNDFIVKKLAYTDILLF